jgi:hypothetical protein
LTPQSTALSTKLAGQALVTLDLYTAGLEVGETGAVRYTKVPENGTRLVCADVGESLLGLLLLAYGYTTALDRSPLCSARL